MIKKCIIFEWCIHGDRNRPTLDTGEIGTVPYEDQCQSRFRSRMNTFRQRSCEKAIFSQVSVCHSVRGVPM